MSELKQPVLQVKDLKVHYSTRGGFLHWGPRPVLKAVDGVSFDLQPGEVLGLVGESGCGKSSLGRAIMRLHEPTSGEILIQGTNFMALRGEALREFRPKIQMIFQDPYASLNPRMTVFEALAEPVRAHMNLSSSELDKRVRGVLDKVGLSVNSVLKYPHEFSGGQRQRVAIARALILDPKVIIADEPVSSLDVSVQAQILNLLKDIQRDLGLSMVFISHNLAVVKYIADRIAVMYLGKIVESASRDQLYGGPLHPYTQALVSAVPIPDPEKERKRKRIQVKGELPSPLNPPVGCAFSSRCALSKPECTASYPELKTVRTPNWKVACVEVKPQL